MQILPYYGSPRPARSDYPSLNEYNSDYLKWRENNIPDAAARSLSPKRLNQMREKGKKRRHSNPLSAPKSKKGSAKLRDKWRKTLLRWFNNKSMVSGKPLGLKKQDYCSHHIVPFSKSKEIMNYYFCWPEVFLTVPMLKSEHTAYHRYTAKMFGENVYPTPINWGVHFCQWVKQYRLDNNISITGGFEQWPALVST